MAEIDRYFTSPEARRRSLEGLDARVRDHFERLISEAERRNMGPRISSVTRSATEQDASASRVACSWHLFGRALDLELLRVLPEDYGELGLWWMALPPDRYGRPWWGGGWTAYGPHGDYMHFHWAPTEGAGEQCGDDRVAAQLAWWSSLRRPGGATRGKALATAAGVLAVIALGLWLLRRRKA